MNVDEVQKGRQTWRKNKQNHRVYSEEDVQQRELQTTSAVDK